MNRELLELLFETTLAGSAAAVVVLATRGPIRRWFGVSAAYAAWLLVPAALAAVALPAAVVTPVLEPSAGLTPVQGAVTPWVGAEAMDPTAWLLALWVVGLIGAGWRMFCQQRRFHVSLGNLSVRSDGLLQSEASEGLPAVVGWRACIVLPADFEQRYEPRQRPLVIFHEQVHRQRGDLWVNAFASLLRCVFWFNPLLHYAARRFRHDQELACDAVVLSRFPRCRRTYGDALLKTELADQPLPVGCHWFGSHPLKERIAMLKHPLPSKTRSIAGLALVVALAVGGGWTAWAAQPARTNSTAEAGDGDLALTLKVSLDGHDEKVDSVNVSAGQAHTFKYEQDGRSWELRLTLTPLDDGTIHASANISRDGVSQGNPVLVFKPETGAALRMGEGEVGPEFKGIAVDLHVSRREVANVTAQGDEVSFRDAALQIAAQSGRRLANPQALPADRMISFNLDDVPAVAALQLIADESGLTLHDDGNLVRFESLQKPHYPVEAADAKEGGLVMLKVLVGTDGQAREVEYVAGESTVSKDSDFTRNAIEAAEQWRFQPSQKDGKPVAGWVMVPVRFEPPTDKSVGDGA